MDKIEMWKKKGNYEVGVKMMKKKMDEEVEEMNLENLGVRIKKMKKKKEE